MSNLHHDSVARPGLDRPSRAILLDGRKGHRSASDSSTDRNTALTIDNHTTKGDSLQTQLEKHNTNRYFRAEKTKTQPTPLTGNTQVINVRIMISIDTILSSIHQGFI